MKKIELVKNFRNYIYICIVIISLPILLNYTIFSWKAIGVNGDWLGFLGNYSGGIVGGIVAYIIAKYQVQQQLSIHKEQLKYQNKKEKELRQYSQLPSLIRLKHIVEQINISVKFAEDIVNEIIPDPETGKGMKFELSTPYGPEFKLEREYHLFLNNIIDIDLSVKLIDLFAFYERFYEAVSYEPQIDAREINKIEAEISELKYRKKTLNIEELEFEKNSKTRKFQFAMIKKQIVWEGIKKESQYNKSSQILEDICNEIELIKRLKQ